MRRGPVGLNSTKSNGMRVSDADKGPHGKGILGDFEPAVACVSYALCSITLSLFNKLVFSGTSFNFPISVLAFQSLCAVVFLKGAAVLKMHEPVPFSTDVLRSMAPVTVLFSLMLWTSGKALRFVSMPTFTVFKNLAVVGTTAWEFFRFGNKVSYGVLASLSLMVSGSVIAGYGDLTFSREGVLWMLVNVVTTVAYVAALKELVPHDISSGAKTLHNNLLSLILFSVVAAAGGELEPFWSALQEQTTGFQLALLFTGVIGTAINMSTFWATRVTSGATYAFVGASNKVPVAIIGHFAFHSVLTVAGWTGVALGLGSGFVYAITKERERRQGKASQAASLAETAPLVKQFHSDEDSSEDDRAELPSLPRCGP